ncbi:hypothetical protein EON64_17820 [archaeon]|nr:MAG: hypothetical protein EON64_17820 [archaeon]
MHADFVLARVRFISIRTQTTTMQSDMPRPKMGEIKLHETSKERDLVQSLAEFYSIIKTADLLEQQYSNDAIKDTEYAEACSKLITQFKNSERGLVRSGTIQSVEDFFQQYNVDCPRAYERLVVSGGCISMSQGSIAYLVSRYTCYSCCVF